MSSLNKVQIIGHLGRDPEMRYMPSGEAVSNIAIATTESWKDKSSGEKKEATEWHRVSAFGKLAEIMGQYLTKGSLVYIEGKLKTRKYTDKDGIEKYATEILASQLQMLGSKQKEQGDPLPENRAPAPRTQSAQSAQRKQPDFSDMGDDIPF